jgi:OOP family OmpA-OmpF porin
MKQLFVSIVVVLALCLSSAVMANTFVKDSKTATAWSPAGMNKILTKTYGYTLTKPSAAPSGYVKIVERKAIFGKKGTAWSPYGYHKIFTAYGLVINKSRVFNLNWIDYCDLVNNDIVWAKGSYAYSPRILARILSIYELPKPPPLDDDRDGVVNGVDQCPNTPVGARVDERGCWVVNATTLFAFDSSIVNASYLPALKDVAKVFSLNPNVSMAVILSGHTDSVGSTMYNQKLSEERAMAVKRALVSVFGIESDRIRAIGYGELKPVRDNRTKKGREMNRRVELSPIW